MSRLFLPLVAALACSGAACSSASKSTSSSSSGAPSSDTSSASTADASVDPPPIGRNDPPPSGSNDDGVDAGICETLYVAAEPKLPKILIVLDRSESMVRDDGGAFGTKIETHRWEQAVPAVKRVTSELDDVIQFGLMVFPGTPPKPYGKDYCEGGHLNVELSTGKAAEIATVLDGTTPKGATPLAKTLDAAREVLTADRGQPDVVARDGYVLLITDGQPTCKDNSNTAADADNAYAAVDRLREADIKTYVIGFDTGGLDVLDNLASRGGTGETKHRAVTDQDQLVKDLEQISRSLVSCKYALSEAPEDPAYVRVQIDGKSYPLGEAGWQLTGEKTIELRGEACTLLQDSKTHNIQISVECAPVVVI